MKRLITAISLAAAVFASASTHAVPVDVENLKVDISGIAQIGYSASELPGFNDQFDVNRLRLRLNASPTDKIKFVGQIEESKNLSPAAFGVQPTGMDGACDSRLVDAYIISNNIKGVTILAGQMPTPVSYEIQTDEYALETINYSSLVGIANRDRGIGIVIPAAEGLSLSTWVLNGSGAVTGASAESSDRKTFGAMIDYKPVKNLDTKIWANFPNMANAAGETKVDAIGGGFDLKEQAGFHFSGEIASLKFKVKDAAGVAAAGDGNKSITWYLNAAYSIPQTNVQAVVRYDVFDPTKALNNTDTNITTAGLNWDFDKSARLQVMKEFKGGVNSNDRIDAQLSIRF